MEGCHRSSKRDLLAGATRTANSAHPPPSEVLNYHHRKSIVTPILRTVVESCYSTTEALALQTSESEDQVGGRGAVDIVPTLQISVGVHLIIANNAGRRVAPQHVGDAVTVIVTHARHAVGRARATNIAPAGHVAG